MCQLARVNLIDSASWRHRPRGRDCSARRTSCAHPLDPSLSLSLSRAPSLAAKPGRELLWSFSRGKVYYGGGCGRRVLLGWEKKDDDGCRGGKEERESDLRRALNPVRPPRFPRGRDMQLASLLSLRDEASTRRKRNKRDRKRGREEATWTSPGRFITTCYCCLSLRLALSHEKRSPTFRAGTGRLREREESRTEKREEGWPRMWCNPPTCDDRDHPETYKPRASELFLHIISLVLPRLFCLLKPRVHSASSDREE